eukprot:GFYU01007661.1.p1 GENE.GFYU01007661.1~~GFYU01007661.1.p1  ORF type:complete len:478 (+),score=54.27 GFYU01007661.1:215-1648(+)
MLSEVPPMMGQSNNISLKRKHPSSHKQMYTDRYIPVRQDRVSTRFSIHMANESSAKGAPSTNSEEKDDSLAAYSLLLKSELLGAEAVRNDLDSISNGENMSQPGTPTKSSLFRWKTENCPSPLRQAHDGTFALSPVGHASQRLLSSPAKLPRKIAKLPYKVLDAPSLQDDFYLNLVDWSSTNVLAVGLSACVYLWSASNGKVTKLCDLSPSNCVTSVSWIEKGTHLAVGTNLGDVQIWDTTKLTLVRTLPGHVSRVGALAWNQNMLASGSRDRSIYLRDFRVPDQFVTRLQGHRQEVCGLKWSPDGQQLASGGNDNKLLIWSPQFSTPMLKFTEHCAAVKAISWSPHQHGVIASGGGTADRCIRFWNTSSNQALHVEDTGSQVCNLVWSKNANELVSTHGYSQNQIIVWRYPGMSKLATLTGHSLRVLYLSMSPNGEDIVTGTGDETLRFWKVFPPGKSRKKTDQNPSLLSTLPSLR